MEPNPSDRLNVPKNATRLINSSTYNLIVQINEDDREDLTEAPPESFEPHLILAGSVKDIVIGTEQCPAVSIKLESNSRFVLKTDLLLFSCTWHDVGQKDVKLWISQIAGSGAASGEELKELLADDVVPSSDDEAADEPPKGYDEVDGPPPMYMENGEHRRRTTEDYMAMPREELRKIIKEDLERAEREEPERKRFIEYFREFNKRYFENSRKQLAEIKQEEIRLLVAAASFDDYKNDLKVHIKEHMNDQVADLKKTVADTHDRSTAVLRRLEDGQQKIMTKQDELSKKFDEMHLSVLGKLDTNCPRLFVVVPFPESETTGGRFSAFRNKFSKKRKSLTTKKYLIKLLCEGDDFSTCHFTKHPGYDIELTRAWVGNLLPFIRVGLKVASIACAVASSGVFNLSGFENMLPPSVAEQLAGDDAEGYEALEGLFSAADEQVTEFGESTTNITDLDATDILKNPDLLQASSDKLKDLFEKLRRESASRNTGDLVQRVNAANQVVWVCEDCGKDMTAVSEKKHK